MGPLSRGPEDGVRIKEWLRTISEFSLVFEFEVHYPKGTEVSNDCFHYQFTQLYMFQSRGNIQVKLVVNRSVCGKEHIFDTTTLDNLAIICFVAIILAGIHAVSTMHYFWVVNKQMNRLQTAFEKKREKEEELN